LADTKKATRRHAILPRTWSGRRHNRETPERKGPKRKIQWLTKPAHRKAHRNPHQRNPHRRNPHQRQEKQGPTRRDLRTQVREARVRPVPRAVREAQAADLFFRRKKVCKFCTEKIDAISYRDVRLLQGFVAERGKIVPRRLTGVCTRHQRKVSQAIKQSRNIALLAFAARF
jgi:small subunit ribosomal protein S18